MYEVLIRKLADFNCSRLMDGIPKRSNFRQCYYNLKCISLSMARNCDFWKYFKINFSIILYVLYIGAA